MKFKISPLTIILFIFLAYFDNIRLYIISYIIISFHEFAHLIAAKLIGLKAEAFVLSPFGANLKLKNKFIYSMSDEIILYLSGPLLNGILAFIGIYFKYDFFFKINFAMFLINLMPILPLDGGMIFLRLLSSKTSFETAHGILKCFSVVLSLICLLLACLSIYAGKINISMFIISVLLIGNVLTKREMIPCDFVNGINCKSKKSNKTKLVVINDKFTVADALKKISPSYTTVALKCDKNGEITKILLENDIINQYSLE